MPIFLILFGVFLLTLFLVIRRKGAAQRLRMSLWLTVSYSFLLLVHLFSGMEYRKGSLWDLLKDDYDLLSFSYVDDEGEFHENVEFSEEAVRKNWGCEYSRTNGCGIFELKKK
jgi:hypothetical protein